MRLTETDASFIYMESASGPMRISSIYVLNGEVPFERIYQRFNDVLHLIPSYRRKLMHVPMSLAHPVWVDDTHFDLANHVIEHRLAEGTSLEDAVDAAVKLNEPMLDRSRPLWKMVAISGVEGKTLLLQMTHHAMIDGASGIDLTTILYDLSPDSSPPTPPTNEWQPEPEPNAATLINEAIQENLLHLGNASPVDAFKKGQAQFEQLRKATEVMTRFVSNPAITAPFNAGFVGPKRKVKWLKKPFSEIREIRRHLGGTINDVVLAIVSEGVARYLDDHKEKTKEKYIRIMCPVSVRTEDQKGALGNQVSAIFPYLPAWPMRSVDRLNIVVEETNRIKISGEAQALTVMQETMPKLPPLGMAATQLVGTAFDPTALAARVPLPIMPNMGYRPPNPNYNFTCTNVPGVQVPQYMCGAEVTDTIGLLVLNGTVGLSLTILSYNKQLFFSFICEPRLLPDLDVLIEHADAVYNELYDAAMADNESL